jgi:hypothetical protein
MSITFFESIDGRVAPNVHRGAYTCTTLRSNTTRFGMKHAVHIVPVFFGSAVSRPTGAVLIELF